MPRKESELKITINFYGEKYDVMTVVTRKGTLTQQRLEELIEQAKKELDDYIAMKKEETAESK